MRKIVTIGYGILTACGGTSAQTDTATARDSAIVAGAPAVPTSRVAPIDSAEITSASPAPMGSRPATPPVTKTTPVASGSAPVRADSVRGVIAVTGTSFEKHVMVAASGRRVEVTGPLSGLIGHVAGAEVTVMGIARGTGIEASSFVVRAVDGQPAIDGTLTAEGGGMYIVTASGNRIRIMTPPPSFQGRNGTRVWITGDPAKGISSFGFIDPPG